MKKQIITVVLAAAALMASVLPMQAQDYNVPQNSTTLDGWITSSGNLATDIAIDRCATLSVAAGLLTDDQYSALNTKIVTKMLSRTGSVTWSGAVGTTTFSSNQVIKVTGNVTLSGTINVTNGATLVVIASGGTRTLTSTNNGGKSSAFKSDGSNIVLKGDSPDHRLVLDGGSGGTTYTDGDNLRAYYETYRTSSPADSKAILVWMQNGGSMRASYTDFQNNWRNAIDSESQQGNGVCFQGSTYRTSGFYDCKFQNLCNCHTNFIRGTAIGLDGAQFTNDFNITSAESTFTLGGLLINKCAFTGNLSSKKNGAATADTSAGGGAIGCEGGKANLRVINSTFTGNACSWFGGAIFWNQNVAAIFKKCKFSKNSGSIGGAIYIEGECNLTDCEFDSNHAWAPSTIVYGGGNGYSGCGGAVYVRCSNNNDTEVCKFNAYGECTFKNNTADLDGGALEIYIDKYWADNNGGTLVYDILIDNDALFESNTAKHSGGAIAVIKSPEVPTSGPNSFTIDADINLKSGTVNSNTVSGTKNNNSSTTPTYNNPGDGGGIYAELSSIIIGDGFVISGNTATSDGGGISAIGDNDAITVGKATITGNTATANGGAVYAKGVQFIMTGGTIGKKDSGCANKAVNGGAVYADAGSSVTISGGNVEYNEATGNGGGFYVNNGVVTFSSGSVSNNTAVNGGGLYLIAGANMTFTNGLLSCNKALTTGTEWSEKTAYGNPGGNNVGIGGGVYLAPGTTSERTTLTFNLSPDSPVGIFSNEAFNAADDIFADYSNTKVTIPEVQFLNLADYSNTADGWYEDYVNKDTRYSSGTNIKTTGDFTRYRESLTDDTKYIWKVPVNSSGTNTYTDRYLALTLGLSLGTLKVKVFGLKPGETFIVNAFRPPLKDDCITNYKPERHRYSLHLTAGADGTATASLDHVHVGYYETTADMNWAWPYEISAQYVGETLTATSGDNSSKDLEAVGSYPACTIGGTTGALDGKLQDEVEYKSSKSNFIYKLKPKDPIITPPARLPLHDEGGVNNKFTSSSTSGTPF